MTDGTATAAPAGSSGGTVLSARGPAGIAAAQAVEDYWTPQRMVAAVPDDTTLPAGAKPDTLNPAERAAAEAIVAAPQAPRRPGGAITQDAAFSYTTGKVFYTLPGGGGASCSGSAIASTRRRLVVTAAHCAWKQGASAPLQNWLFVPGYQNGGGRNAPGPRGKFTLFNVSVWSQWLNDGQYSYDYAFVVTNNSDLGQRVVDAVGGHGLAANANYPYVHAAGYPGNLGGAEIQWYCWGDTSRKSRPNPDAALDCPMRAGSSGGPWLRDYDHSTGRGWAVGVTSYDLGGDLLYSPYFDNDTTALYNSAEAASPAS